jgi:hypothetical protein
MKTTPLRLAPAHHRHQIRSIQSSRHHSDKNLSVVAYARHLYPALGNALDTGIAPAHGGEHVGGLEAGRGPDQEPPAQQAHG